MNYIYYIISIVLIISCGDDNFKKYAKLDSFRVLAIIADNPEVGDTNETVILTPIVSDIENKGRVITVTVVGCIDPGISRGEEISCDGESSKQEITYNNNNPVDLNSLLLASYYTGAIPSVSITLPSNILSTRDEIDKINGVDYLVLFTFSIDGEEVINTFKRITVSENISKNINPTLGDIGALELKSNKQNMELEVTSSPETFIYYSLSEGQKTSTEKFYLSWFTSNGSISNSQVYIDESSVLQLDESLPEKAIVTVVLRDGRGGVAFNSVLLE